MITTRYNLTITTTQEGPEGNASAVHNYEASSMEELMSLLGYGENPEGAVSLQAMVMDLTTEERPFQAGDRVRTAYGCGTIVGMTEREFFVHMDDGPEGQNLMSFSSEAMSLLEETMNNTPAGPYKRYSHTSPSGRANVPVRQINGYGDNPWVLGLGDEREDDNGLDTNTRDTSKTSTKNTVKESDDPLKELRRLSGL